MCETKNFLEQDLPTAKNLKKKVFGTRIPTLVY